MEVSRIRTQTTGIQGCRSYHCATTFLPILSVRNFCRTKICDVIENDFSPIIATTINYYRPEGFQQHTFSKQSGDFSTINYCPSLSRSRKLRAIIYNYFQVSLSTVALFSPLTPAHTRKNHNRALLNFKK